MQISRMCGPNCGSYPPADPPVSFQWWNLNEWEKECVVLLEEQRRRVVRAGLLALERGIVHGTAGNFSEIDRTASLVAISRPAVSPTNRSGSRMQWCWTLLEKLSKVPGGRARKRRRIRWFFGSSRMWGRSCIPFLTIRRL